MGSNDDGSVLSADVWSVGALPLVAWARWGTTPEQSPMTAQSLRGAQIENNLVWEPDVLLDLLR